MVNGPTGGWIGYGVGDSGQQVAKIQHRLIFAFPKNSQALRLGVQETGVYDQATELAVFNVQPFLKDEKGKPLPATGIANYATQLALGAVVKQGPPAKKFFQQGVGYPAMGFLQPDPNMSYVESRKIGTGELIRLATPDTRPKVVIGYSQGDDVVGYFLEQWPENRADEIKMVVGFGSPSRPLGNTLLGNDPGGCGISGHWTPERYRNRTYHFTHDGDMYANARGMLFLLYDILTRMEVSLDFAMYLFQVLMTEGGKILLGITPSDLEGAGALSMISKLATTGLSTVVGKDVLPPLTLFTLLPQLIWLIIDALKFVSTNAHMHYHDMPLPEWRGLTAVDCAAQLIKEKVKEAQQTVVYTVAGTWASWNDGPPAWTAWQLP
jgi:hypothetical protein